jgi:DNA modification methylase
MENNNNNEPNKNQDIDLFGEPIIKDEILRDKFLEPPFSVLDTKTGSWQNRKRAWLRKGIKSELGRDAECNTTTMSGMSAEEYFLKYGRKPMEGTSIFDPVLCELIYKWYCPEGGNIFDPFAGGSVRGIVANYLGFNYTGVDIRQEQVESNRAQAIEILPVNRQPQWYCEDSNVWLNEHLAQGAKPEFDLVFSCPPYGNLEVYSDLEGDISNKNYTEFLEIYRKIIFKACKFLKPGGFACFVVGDFRDKHGFYHGFVGDTVKAFQHSGVGFYNDAVLLNALGTAMLRANMHMKTGKLVKVHQNVLIFKKK